MMDEHIREMLKYIRFRGLLTDWDRYIELAVKEDFSPVKLLNYIVEEEYKIKKGNSRRLRLSRAKIPEKYVIETYPFQRQPNLNKKKVLSLYDAFDYIEKKQNHIWIGPTGVGKTGLATAFLMQAVNHGYSGRFILFPDLIELLYNSIADHSEASVIKTFSSYDCLLVDEIGYIEVQPVQVGLFFTLMHRRHKRKTTMITSNLGFQKWTSFLKNNQLTAALIDRLTENSHVINMKDCVSLRPRLDKVE